jgi:hypothetical protein
MLGRPTHCSGRGGSGALWVCPPVRSQWRCGPAAELSRSITSGVKRCDASFVPIFTPGFCAIGRGGARTTRRLSLRIAVDGLPPDVCLSGTGRGLGRRVFGRRFTPTRVVPSRGCPSSETRLHPVCPCCERIRVRQYLRRERNVPGTSPPKGNQCSCNRPDDLLGLLAARYALSIPFAEEDLRPPTRVLYGVGQSF